MQALNRRNPYLSKTNGIITKKHSIFQWQFIWGSTVFSSRQAYKQLSGHLIIHPVFKWL